MKIRTRLLITSILLFAAGAFWLLDWLLQDFRYHYYNTMEESMVDTSTILASMVSAELGDGDIEVGEAFRRGMTEANRRKLSARIYDFTKTNMNVRVLVTDAAGLVKYDSRDGAAEGEDYSVWRDVRLTLAGEYGARASYAVKTDPESLTFFIGSPLLVDGEVRGVLSVGKPVRSVLPIMRKAKRRLIGMGVVAVTALLLIQVLVSSWVTQPIRKLIAYARAVRDGRHTARPRFERGEMGELANAFEEMRDALEGREYVEEYVQSLTHEMKSPLAAIQGAAELLDEEMPQEQRARFLKNIQTESDRLHGLVNRMLALAAIEKRKDPARSEPIDIHALLDDVTDSLLPLLRGKDVTVRCSIEKETKLHGEYFLLRQAVANLVQNAVGFSPSGAEVEIRVFSRGGFVAIQVSDQGAGIPDYAVERVFDRFYSLPRPGNGTKSSGLGLNFVREIAHLHGGETLLANRPEGGAVATLSIPAKPSA